MSSDRFLRDLGRRSASRLYRARSTSYEGNLIKEYYFIDTASYLAKRVGVAVDDYVTRCASAAQLSCTVFTRPFPRCERGGTPD